MSQVSDLLQTVVLSQDNDDGIPLEMRRRVQAALAQLQKLQREESGDQRAAQTRKRALQMLNVINDKS